MFDGLEDRWIRFNLQSVEDDLKDIFEAVLKTYEQMKRKARSKGESEESLTFDCRRSMEEMRTIYQKNLPWQAERVDFSDRRTQWSYTYLYMLRHVHLVYYALKKTIQEHILQVKPSDAPMNVCMVGGGPGSDILGICLLMKEYRCRAPWTNQVFVLDACSRWEYSWNSVYNLLPETFRQGVPEVKYCRFNYRDSHLSTANQQRINNADVVTMIKSLSSAAAWLKNREKVYGTHISSDGKRKKKLTEWHSVYSILKNMKPGAILLFLDNKTGSQRQILTTTATYLKFEFLLEVDLRDVRMPTSFLAFNREFSKKIDWRPCSSAGDNEMIVLRKPGYLCYGVKLEAEVPNPNLSAAKGLPQSEDCDESMHNLFRRANGGYLKTREEKETSIDGHGSHTFRVPLQTAVTGIQCANNVDRQDGVRYLTETRGANKVEGGDRGRGFNRNNSKISSQASITAAHGTNGVEGVDGNGNRNRYDSKTTAQVPVNETRRANRVKGVDEVRNLDRYSLQTIPQTSVTTRLDANKEIAKGHSKHTAKVPPQSFVTSSRLCNSVESDEEADQVEFSDTAQLIPRDYGRDISRMPPKLSPTTTPSERFHRRALCLIFSCCPVSATTSD